MKHGTDNLEPHRNRPTIPVAGPSLTTQRENVLAQYLETVRRQQELAARLGELGVRVDEVAS